MSTPTGITITNNYGVIIEINDTIINTTFSSKLGGGYVRQIGASVDNCNVDDFVQFNADKQFLFQQSSVTFCYLDSRDILFIQTALP